MRFRYQIGEQIRTLDLEANNGGYRATLDGETYDVESVRAEQGGVSFIVGDQSHLAHVAVDGPNRWVFMDGRPFVLQTANASAGRGRSRAGGGQAGGDRTILSPMPGQVRAVQVEQGATVDKGQTLLLLEAMKMEIRVQSPRAGRVARLLVQQGQTVDRDQVLVELE